MKKVTVLIGVLGLILMMALSTAAQSTTMIGGSIRFAPGATSQVISGRLDGGVAVRYEFYASANQSATITLNSDTNAAVLGVKTLKGQVLLSLDARSATFGMPLPVSGGYELLVYNPGQMATNFSFLLSIPPISTKPGQTAIPANPYYPVPGSWQYRLGGTIQFAKGETMTEIAGTSAGGTCTRYDFYAGNDYLLLATVSSDNNRVNLGLSDNTGTLYVSNANQFGTIRQLLSKTTKYNLDVCNPDMAATGFRLTFVIPARVRFAPNTNSTRLTGAVKANGVVSYTAYAAAGQTMIVGLQSGTTQPNAFLRISGIEDGTVFLDHTAKLTYWSGVLPRRQDYLIEVVSFQQATNYSLSIQIY